MAAAMAAMASKKEKEKEEKKREGCSRGSESDLMEEEEIPAVEEILWRLPVKPLARFRSVCKSWNSIIASDPKFAILQLKNSSISRTSFDRQRVMLWNWLDWPSAFLLEKKNHQLLTTNDNITNTSEFAIKKINTNLAKFLYHFSIVATCDGLVCLHSEKYESIFFWNPLTGKTKRVSDSPAKIPRNSGWRTNGYGLGYDSSTDDYKLVWIRHGLENIPYNAGVFSLRTNSWRQIEDFPIKFGSLSPGVFINGYLYWIGHSTHWTDPPYMLVSFNLEKEKYKLLDIPATDQPGMKSMNYGIRILDNKLAIYYPSNVEGSYYLLLINVWENSESWIKHTVTIPNSMSFIPLCLLENVEELLFQGNQVTSPQSKLGVYCLKDGTFRHLQIFGLPKGFTETTFSESLVSPNTYEGTKN